MDVFETDSHIRMGNCIQSMPVRSKVTILKVLPLLLLMCLVSTKSFTQIGDRGYGRVIARVVRTSHIEPHELTYGNIAVVLAGTIEMTPSGKDLKNSDIKLPVSSGTFTAAAFYVAGPSGYSYSIAIPESPVSINSGEEEMTVRSFNSDPNLGPGKDQIGGIYVSVSPYYVTVNYN